jgi:hypothetical protein
MKKKILLLLFLVSGLFVIAQDPPVDDPGGGGPGGDPGGDPDLVPIDSGLVFLLAAGVAYGAKKGIEFKSKQE